MGCDSTLDVSREAAIEKILSSVSEASNDQLAEMLYSLWGEENFYNFIVSDYRTDDNDDYRLC